MAAPGRWCALSLAAGLLGGKRRLSLHQIMTRLVLLLFLFNREPLFSGTLRFLIDGRFALVARRFCLAVAPLLLRSFLVGERALRAVFFAKSESRFFRFAISSLYFLRLKPRA